MDKDKDIDKGKDREKEKLKAKRAKLREKWLFPLNLKSLVLILIGLGFNLAGREVAEILTLPFFLDNIGTLTSAILLGPLGGAVTGAIMNIILYWRFISSLPYIIVSIVIGINVGLLYPRNRKPDPFTVIGVAIMTGFLAVLFSTPLNLIIYEGYTGNVWGDALIDMLNQFMNARVFTCFLGEAFVDIPDKTITAIISISIISLYQKYIKKPVEIKSPIRKAGGKTNLKAFIALFITMYLALSMLTQGIEGVIIAEAAYAKNSGDSKDKVENKGIDFISDYAAVSYDTEDGLAASEINTITQTRDGFIWAGAYSGLYRYNGSRFEKINYKDHQNINYKISSVTELYEDSKGTLWIGTNESGLAAYDPESGELEFFTMAEGLPSNSIRTVQEDHNGLLYIGSTSSICILDPESKKVTVPDWPDISGVRSMTLTSDNVLIGITNGGVLFFCQDGELLDARDSGKEEGGAYYCAIASDAEDSVIVVGTSADYIIKMKRDGIRTKEVGRYYTGGISYFNNISYSNDPGGYFICCENGLGFLDNVSGKITEFKIDGFNSSISDSMVDYQGNVWFASNKQGILCYSRNPFENVFTKAELKSDVVNCVLQKDNYLLIGMDSGLAAVDLRNGKPVALPFFKRFDGARVRHIMEDSKGNIWVSTYGADGLLEISPDGKSITVYNEERANTEGGRFRLAVELSDGTIAASTNTGINFIKDGKVKYAMGKNEGVASQILSIRELSNGSVLAGSDGSGIYIIKDGKVIGEVGEESGLSSLVIMKIIPSSRGGYFLVTSNAIYHYAGKYARRLDNFPYSNNYDIYISDDGMAWVLSSAGIFVLSEDSLVNNNAEHYTLLNRSRGFYTSLTANSTLAEVGDEIYLCCTDGVRKISSKDYNTVDVSYSIRMSSLTADGEEILPENGVYVIPQQKSRRIEFNVAVLNFTLSNPLVKIFLEGSDDEGITCYQNEISPLIFTNLQYGTYALHVQIVDQNTEEALRDVRFFVNKEPRLFEKDIFKIYLTVVCVLFLFFIGWAVGNLRELTSRFQGLEKAVETDEMTGLLNKNGSLEKIGDLLKRSEGILMMIDLDSFKLVNDIYGHDMGDKVLIRFSELIRSCLRPQDLAGRIGGDEFIAYIQNTQEEGAVAERTRFLNEEIIRSAKEYMGEDMEIPLGVSIGAVIAPNEGTDYAELRTKADKALYEVKQHGKHGYAFYHKHRRTSGDKAASDMEAYLEAVPEGQRKDLSIEDFMAAGDAGELDSTGFSLGSGNGTSSGNGFSSGDGIGSGNSFGGGNGLRGENDLGNGQSYNVGDNDSKNGAERSDSVGGSSFNQLQMILGERNIGRKAYIVDIENLKAIYRLYKRIGERFPLDVRLAHFMLSRKESGERKGEPLSEDEMYQFEDCLSATLRNSDVLSRYGSRAFLALLIGTSEEHDRTIEKRVLTKWNEYPESKEINLRFEAHEVS